MNNKKCLESIHLSTQTHFANQKQINDSLLAVQENQSAQLARQIPDQSLTLRKEKLLQEVLSENCVLTVHNATVVDGGVTGWKQILDDLPFRQNFTKQPFRNGILKNIELTGGKYMSTVSFKTKHQRDLFFRSVEKKDTQVKFYHSFPIQYRAANKDFHA